MIQLVFDAATSAEALGKRNIAAAFVYALTIPFVAIVTTYLCFDSRIRRELETAADQPVLPAEIEA